MELQETSVAVFGLGNMGGALARALHRGGHPVTGWNRSDRSRAAAEWGIGYAHEAAAAVHGANLIIFCLSSYAASDEVLGLPGVAEALKGKVMVQLTTGLPDQARTMAEGAKGLGIRYLDGKIAVVPDSIGAGSAVIFYAGDQALFDAHRPVLQALGGAPTYVGADAGAASHADFAFLCYFFLSTIGLLYGAAFAGAAGIDPDKLLALAPNFSKDLLGRVPSFRKALATGDFMSEVQSSLRVDLNGARLLAETAAALRLDTAPADLMADAFARAVAGGLAEADTGALAGIFRRPG